MTQVKTDGDKAPYIFVNKQHLVQICDLSDCVKCTAIHELLTSEGYDVTQLCVCCHNNDD